MSRQVFLFIGDGTRAPEKGELVGKTIEKEGRHGKVVENDHLTITVEWEVPPAPSDPKTMWSIIKEAFKLA